MTLRWLRAAACLALLGASAQAGITRDYDAFDYYAVHLSPSADPAAISSHLGLRYEGPLGELTDHHVFRADFKRADHDHIQSQLDDLTWRRRRRDPAALEPHVLDHVWFNQKQELHSRFPLVKRDVPGSVDLPSVDPAKQQGLDIAAGLDIQDPIFQDQWHLFNHVQLGHDINVTGVWQSGITGTGSTVCIVDDGLDMDSDDLRDNYFAAGSYDFNDHVEDPKPRLSDDRHGTRCAGEVAAVRNNVCGVGVAYDSKVSGARILSKVITDADEAVAMNYAYQDNHIYSCSWGPPDDGRSMEGPGILIKRAMVNGVQKGRGGLGSIYVFAIGNGAAADDNCNFDGYTNSIYSVSVGGIDRKGLHPYYSEKCSAQLVVTYSSGSSDAIHTTDVGKDTCYSNHGGTSAAGPLVAGIYALVLEANPTLTWRDIQWLTVLTAVRIDQPADWAMNKAVGKEFSHDFGYGKADAWALVEAAKSWTNVKAQAWFYSPWLSVRRAIPQGNQGLASSFEVTKDMLQRWNLERVEHVTVTMNVEHTRRGDLSVELRSPSGMVSHIATARRRDEAEAGYNDWTFMSVAHWGEDGVGKWTVVVKDTSINDHNGTFVDWHLKLWGECIDPDRAEVLPLPSKSDDDHEAIPIPTQDASATVTSVDVPTHTGEPEGNPTDHPDRPVNSKHSSTTESLPTTTAAPPSEDEEVETPATTTATSTSTSTSGSHFLPKPFPTFGVSKNTQFWIYGAIILILIFLAVLASWWLILLRRKRRWMSRSDYAFEMVDHADAEDKADGERHGMLNGGSGRRKKRAGELYDAFATGDSEDDDDELFDLGADSDEDEDGSDDVSGRHKDGSRYRDDEPTREGTDV